MNKKRLLGIILSITLVLGLTPTVCMTARADDNPIEYPLWVGGTQVTSDNKNNVLVGDQDNDGKVIYDPSTNTLTLNGADITYDSADAVIYYTGNYLDGDLTIELSGTNNIKNTVDFGSGIKSHYGGIGIIITGSEILKVSSSYGIKSTGPVTISGATVNATVTYCGIESSNSVTIKDNSTVEVKGTDVAVYGIHAAENITIESGEVTASGINLGLYANDGDVIINGGTVTTTGTHAGIYAYSGSVKIGGKETEVEVDEATGPYTAEPFCGIYAKNNITIEGGKKVTATGDKYGLFADSGAINISGGEVTAKATGSVGYGIYTENGDITISGGDRPKTCLDSK